MGMMFVSGIALFVIGAIMLGTSMYITKISNKALEEALTTSRELLIGAYAAKDVILDEMKLHEFDCQSQTSGGVKICDCGAEVLNAKLLRIFDAFNLKTKDQKDERQSH